METLSEEQIKGQVLDHLGLIAATIEKLDLIEHVDRLLPVSMDKGAKATMGQRAAAMILNGLGFIDDRLYMFPEFLNNKPVERLLGKGLSAAYFNDDALGRFLDTIYAYGTTKFFTEIAFKVGVDHHLLGKSAHFDTSTISVYGEYVEDEVKEGCIVSPQSATEKLPVDLNENSNETEAGLKLDHPKKPIRITHGYSKAKRPDLKQMVINLATTGAAGFPVWMEAHNGNASDKKIMLAASKKMKEFCKNLKGAPDFLYVGDSAMYENSVKHGAGMKWLSRVPESIGEAKALLRRPDEVFSWKEQENGYRISPLKSHYGGVEQRWLMVHSEQAFSRESKTLDKNIAREKEDIEKALWHLSNQHFKCETDARQAAQKTVKTLKYHFAALSVTTIKKHAKKGRPKKDALEFITEYSIAGKLTPDEEKITVARRRKGRFILATTELDQAILSDEAILPEYKGQSKTESSFRFIKGNAFEVSSVFLKKPERIEALMAIMTLCLMVYSFAQHHLRAALEKCGDTLPDQMKKPTKKPTMAWVCRMFHGVQLLHITLPSLVQQLVINLTEITKRIIRYFGRRAELIYGLPAG
jgi:transposase